MGRPPTSLRALAAAALAGGVLAGCGTTAVSTSGLSGDQKAVATTVSNFQNDALDNQASKICSNDLAPAVVKALEAGGKTCTSVITEQLKVVNNFNLAIVPGTIKVVGPVATVQVQDTQNGKSKHVNTLRLVRSGSTWKISNLV